MNQLQILLKKLLELLGILEKQLSMQSSSERLYKSCLKFLNHDASPEDDAPDSLGCAETVEDIYFDAFKEWIGNVKLLSTIDLNHAMSISKNFRRVGADEMPKRGQIIISPTNGSVHGHVGYFMSNFEIASNDSRNGLFMVNYTRDGWARYYNQKLGLPVYIYERI